jgi:tetrahydromethanopterin S-methyltransferase subunit E
LGGVIHTVKAFPFVLALITFSIVTAAFAATPAVHGFPPTCTPIPSLPLSYVGSVSGCGSQAGKVAPCIAGENVQFRFGDGVNACCPARYLWQFETGLVSSGAAGTISHQFVAPGTYTVKVSVFACPDPVVATKVVTVVSASAIPVLNLVIGTLLVLFLGAVAAYRLR